MPSAVLAFSSGFEKAPASSEANPGIETFAPALVDPSLARTLTVRSLPRGKVFRFTPAGNANRSDRSVTVAVRVDAEMARAIAVRKVLGGELGGGSGSLRISQTAYNLGISRGYQTFAQAFVLPGGLNRSDMPDLAAFKLGSGTAPERSRLSPRIAFDEREKTGRAPRTLEGNGEQTVDVGGAYRLTRNFDVTAGVRYSRERDRLLPLVDGRQDSQAVYVGTQFHF
ncbi:MAG: hypothetical protein V4579_00670 [Pseudomonadota bacterium]